MNGVGVSLHLPLNLAVNPELLENTKSILKAPESPSTQAGKSDVTLATPIPLLTASILKTCEFHHQTISLASILPYDSPLPHCNDLTSFIPHLPKGKGDRLKAYTISLHLTAVRIKNCQSLFWSQNPDPNHFTSFLLQPRASASWSCLLYCRHTGLLSISKMPSSSLPRNILTCWCLMDMLLKNHIQGLPW